MLLLLRNSILQRAIFPQCLRLHLPWWLDAPLASQFIPNALSDCSAHFCCSIIVDQLFCWSNIFDQISNMFSKIKQKRKPCHISISSGSFGQVSRQSSHMPWDLECFLHVCLQKRWLQEKFRQAFLVLKTAKNPIQFLNRILYLYTCVCIYMHIGMHLNRTKIGYIITAFLM